MKAMTQRGPRWALATPHTVASEVAADVLRVGGNAIDGALAASAVLTVVYPNQCSVGGDLIALVGLPDGAVRAVNGSGAAPRGIDRETILRQYGSMPTKGPMPVTVPGMLSAWETMAAQWGTRPLSQALDAAQQIAHDGVTVADGLARDLVVEAEYLAHDPGMLETFFRDGRPLRAGEQLKQPALAATITQLRDEGVRAFYNGPIGASIVKTLQQMGSTLSLEDLQAHRTRLVNPVATVFRGKEYLSSPPNSQGLFFLGGLKTLAVLEDALGRNLNTLDSDAGLVAHVLSALAWDRDQLLGDPSEAGRMVDLVLSDQRLGGLARHMLDSPITKQTATQGEADQSAPVQTRRSGDTVAVVVADGEGHWVSLIQSNFHAFGSGILDPASGVVLHNRGASFSLDAGSPNRIGPRRVPLHTLMPVLVRTNGQFVGAHGTMGGRAQPQIHTQVVLTLEGGMNTAEAVAAPRWVLGAMEAGLDEPAPSRMVSAEEDVPQSALRSLHDAGFTTKTLPAHDDGTGHFQIVRAIDGERVGASDPRADGSALAG